MSSDPHAISSASNPSPRLRPDDGEQENNEHVQMSILATSPPAGRLEIDLEMASTELFLELHTVVHNLTSEVGAEPTESTSFRRIDDIRQALGDYSSAMEAYRTFRKEPGDIDSDDHMMFLAGMLTELDTKRSQLKAAQESNSETADDEAVHVAPSAEEISSLEAKIAHVIVNGVKFSSAVG
ncbi:hypothetical protein Neosp_002511 [[Neocosmospora] mangrovei]